mmetsp:Transcript_2407/g.293  ORF Transcript_2407/g.293 Transcript_2407/m.293 type:complete len:96 (+) Transcript_2407:662-949(+)
MLNPLLSHFWLKRVEFIPKIFTDDAKVICYFVSISFLVCGITILYISNRYFLIRLNAIIYTYTRLIITQVPLLRLRIQHYFLIRRKKRLRHKQLR